MVRLRAQLAELGKSLAPKARKGRREGSWRFGDAVDAAVDRAATSSAADSPIGSPALPPSEPPTPMAERALDVDLAAPSPAVASSSATSTPPPRPVPLWEGGPPSPASGSPVRHALTMERLEKLQRAKQASPMAQPAAHSPLPAWASPGSSTAATSLEAPQSHSPQKLRFAPPPPPPPPEAEAREAEEREAREAEEQAARVQRNAEERMARMKAKREAEQAAAREAARQRIASEAGSEVDSEVDSEVGSEPSAEPDRILQLASALSESAAVGYTQREAWRRWEAAARAHRRNQLGLEWWSHAASHAALVGWLRSSLVGAAARRRMETATAHAERSAGVLGLEQWRSSTQRTHRLATLPSVASVSLGLLTSHRPLPSAWLCWCRCALAGTREVVAAAHARRRAAHSALGRMRSTAVAHHLGRIDRRQARRQARAVALSVWRAHVAAQRRAYTSRAAARAGMDRGGHPLSWIHHIAQPRTPRKQQSTSPKPPKPRRSTTCARCRCNSPNMFNGPRTAFGNGSAGP